jgi:hypothetical protein
MPDLPITQLPAGAEFKGNSIIAAVNDPAGTPATQRFTADQVAAYLLRGMTPGVRLTLEQGVAITTTDKTGITSIFAEPVNGGLVPIFTDTAGTIPGLCVVPESTVSVAIGTLASAVIPVDVFGRSNAGVLALELLPWTNTTTRATALNNINGRWYKTGDATRLLLGSFYPTSTTTTADAAANRLLSNVFNAVRRDFAKASAGGSHTYALATARPWANDTANRVGIMIWNTQVVSAGISFDTTPIANGLPGTGIALNSTTVQTIGATMGASSSAPRLIATQLQPLWLPAGYNFLQQLEVEYSALASTFGSASILGIVEN